VIFDNCIVGRHAHVRRAIIDKNFHVPDHARIGYEPELDAAAYHVTDSGIIVVEGHRSPVDIATVLL